MEIRFKINNEKFYNNGKVILKSIPDIENLFRDILSKKEKVEDVTRVLKGKPSFDGITANSLNEALRRCLFQANIKGETHVENGVFFHNTKEGFDFSIYDENYNLSRLFNYYQGAVGILNGDQKIKELFQKMGYPENQWLGIIKSIESKIEYNTDYLIDKETLTVVGELQFGNWALLYRDLFRLLHADSNPGIDLYIYIAADTELSSLLSANTVSYKQVQTVIGEYLSVIRTPIWLIGLGVDRL